MPDADVVYLRRSDAGRDTGGGERIRRQGHQGHGTRQGHQGGWRGTFVARQPGRGGADGQAPRGRGTLRSAVWTQRPGARVAGPARRRPDQQANRGQDVPRREDRQKLCVTVVGQAGHGTPHPGGGIHLQARPIPPPHRRGSAHDGRATITGMRADSTTAELTEPSNIPANPPRP